LFDNAAHQHKLCRWLAQADFVKTGNYGRKFDGRIWTGRKVYYIEDRKIHGMSAKTFLFAAVSGRTARRPLRRRNFLNKPGQNLSQIVIAGGDWKGPIKPK